MPFEIIRGDITEVKSDAIVNAANEGLQRGGGVCGAIFAAAGARDLQIECDRIGHCPTGQAVITGAYALEAKHIIHTVGPIWRGGSNKEEGLLYDCYANSLELARANGCESVAFPLISSGIYGYPKEEALRVAKKAIQDFLQDYEMLVYLVIFDRRSFPINEKLRQAIDDYIADNFLEEDVVLDDVVATVNAPMISEDMLFEEVYDVHDRADAYPLEQSRSLQDAVDALDESFTDRLLRLIDESGKSDPEVYKGANMDRKLFSKIRKGNGYQPSKSTAIALAVSLELNLDDTLDLLKTAGYTLSQSNYFDVIVNFFIENEVYDIFVINEALFAYEQKLLGA
jgi:O-acetyl-ADP-ribose deacetylase (regulator of RNase III)